MTKTARLGSRGGPALLLPENVKYIAVHCSATAPNADIGKEEIEGWHRERGFFGIGYHFVIRRNGAVESGRPLHLAGAHVMSHNLEAVGVCLVGGVDSSKLQKPQANFTPEQMGALRVLTEQLLEIFPAATVQGHRDFPHVAKACPSFDVKHWFETGHVI